MFIRINYKKTVILILINKKAVILINIKKSFFVKHFFLSQDSFFDKRIKFGKRKELKKELSDELMPATLHPNKWLDWCTSEDDKNNWKANGLKVSVVIPLFFFNRVVLGQRWAHNREDTLIWEGGVE